MIGVCGWVRTGDASLMTPADALVSALRHRGEFARHEEEIFFLAGEHIANTRQIVVAFSGRLDNRRALNNDLDLPRKASPAETVAAAFQRWPNDLQHRLMGDYVLACWHRKYRSLTLVRDRLGVAPLYYCSDRNDFLFASEQTAIATVKACTINPGRVADYMHSYEWITEDESWFSEINRLPPAQLIQLNNGNLRRSRYWTPQVDTAVTRSDVATNVQHLRSLLNDVLGERITRNTAVQFSGGLDSLTVAEAALGRKRGITLLAGIAEGDPGDSTTIAQYAALRPDVPMLTVDVDKDLDSGYLHQLHDTLDDPFPAPHTLTLALFARARQQGITNLLDGVEGDLTFSLGSDFTTALLASRQYAAWWQQLSLLRQSSGARWPLQVFRSVSALLAPNSVRKLRFSHRTFPALQATNREMFRPPFSDVMTDRYEKLVATDVNYRGSVESLHRHQLAQPYINVALERYDKLAAVSNVSVSHPLLDQRLVEFGLSLPWQQKRQGELRKVLMRELHRGSDVEAIAYRTDKPHLGGAFTAALCAREIEPVNAFFAGGGAWQNWLQPALTDPCLNRPTSPGEYEYVWLIYRLAKWLDKWG